VEGEGLLCGCEGWGKKAGRSPPAAVARPLAPRPAAARRSKAAYPCSYELAAWVQSARTFLEARLLSAEELEMILSNFHLLLHSSRRHLRTRRRSRFRGCRQRRRRRLPGRAGEGVRLGWSSVAQSTESCFMSCISDIA
jgi:hypothetical protein